MKKQNVGRFEVQTRFVGALENCWTDISESGEETPVVFSSVEEAQAAIDEHIEDCVDAVTVGNMEDAPTQDEFRIVEIV